MEDSGRSVGDSEKAKSLRCKCSGEMVLLVRTDYEQIRRRLMHHCVTHYLVRQIVRWLIKPRRTYHCTIIGM